MMAFETSRSSGCALKRNRESDLPGEVHIVHPVAHERSARAERHIPAHSTA